jgi:hypothetical protein
VAGAPAGLPGFLETADLSQRAAGPPSLSVSQPQDAGEREAARVASIVLGSADPAPAHIEAGSPADLARRAEPGGAAGPPPAALPGPTAATLGTAAAAGQPLPSTARATLEPLFGRGLGGVRVHTGTPAGELSRAIQARAFTHGRDIFFAPGRYEPTSRSGLALLAHEVTHVVQGQRAGAADLQAQLEEDFAGRQEVAVAAAVGRLAEYVRVTNRRGAQVLAPYRIYQIDQIPTRYDDQFVLTRETEVRTDAGRRRETVRTTLGELRETRRASAGGLQYTVMVASYDGRLHMVGYDSYMFSVGGGPDAYLWSGWVESKEPRSGIGKNLFVERIRQVLVQGVGRMQLMVNRGDPETVEFHRRVWEVAGVPQAERVSEYWLNVRRMASVLAAWGENLGADQRRDLATLASGTAEPTVAGVQAILKSSGPGGGPGGSTGPPGGGPIGTPGSNTPGTSGRTSEAAPVTGELPAGTAPAVASTLQRLKANTRTPAPLGSVASLHDPEVVQRVVTSHHGLAEIGGTIYEVVVRGDLARSVTIRPVEPRLITMSLPAESAAAPAGALAPLPGGSSGTSGSGGGAGRPSGSAATLQVPLPPGQYFTAAPPVLNLRPAGNIVVGGTLIPPSLTTAQPGELVIVHNPAEIANSWLVTDPATGKAVAGVLSGGQVCRLTEYNRWNLTVDESGRVVRPETITVGGQRLQTTPVGPEPPAGTTARTGVGRYGSVPFRAAGVGLGLLAVANDILAPIAATYQVQRQTNAMWEAQIDFWARFGAEPTWRVWDWDRREALSWETEPRTGLDILESHRTRYVADINVEAFKRALPGLIHNYQDLELFLALGNALGLGQGRAIRKEGDRYLATVNGVVYGMQIEYDITATIEQIRARTITQTDAQMQAELRGLPPAEIGNIFRLKSGSSASLFRSASGGQELADTRLFLGPNPWVRLVGQERSGGVWRWFRYGQWRDRVLVAPANGDALRAAQLATYRVGKQDIDETLEEVKEGGREILSYTREWSTPELQRHGVSLGALQGFVAGPDPAGRFGMTRYARDPADPEDRTIAVGELKQFWVNARDLEPVEVLQVLNYAALPSEAAP